eukprot:TRINITY_DN25287_c0_g1_i1.p1 TRINITY_DN25287_c0_g1~~TRINITY_DN25287_c0_g1_i1.p1  ORF type:complete len:220 (-),score=63.96 TRINITY_DN25287_c0_g1_i1:38-697(-)
MLSRVSLLARQGRCVVAVVPRVRVLSNGKNKKQQNDFFEVPELVFDPETRKYVPLEMPEVIRHLHESDDAREVAVMTGSFDFLNKSVEAQVAKAMRSGEFDDLQGKGKPLKEHDSQNAVHTSKAEQIANRIFVKNDVKPAWIAHHEQIKNRRQNVRELIRKAIGTNNDKLMAQANQEMQEINKLIKEYNMSTPSMFQQMFPMNADLEIKQAKEEQEKKS